MADQKTPEVDTRVDEYALSIFKAMGYDPTGLPDTLVRFYNAFKKKKDSLYPGRVTPEGFALCSTLYDLIDGDLARPEEPAGKVKV